MSQRLIRFAHAASLAVAALSLIVAPAYAANELLISNFNNTGPSYIYGGFTGTVGAADLSVSGVANGGLVWDFPLIDLTARANDMFYLTAQLLPGNQSDIQILINTDDVGAANNYVYYYQIPAAAFSSNGFTTALTSALNNPAFVLDDSNNFSFVGSGGAFAPNLAKVREIQIQGAPYGTNSFVYRFDQFSVGSVAAVVPEASTFALVLPALGMVGTVLVRRRKG